MLGVGLALCSTLCYTPPAGACSGPECTAPVRLPALAWLPGNLVNFQVLAQDPGVLTLRTAAGEPIAASIRTLGADRVFAPEAAIPADTDVVLEYRASCFDGPASATSTFSFVTMAAAAIELRPAQLTLEEKGFLYAGGEVAAAFVRLRHEGPVANSQALALSSSQAWVDADDHQQLQGAQVEIVAPCGSTAALDIDTCNPPLWVDPGAHSVEVRTHLVGQATQPEPARLEVDLRCPASTPAAVAGNDAGASDVGQAGSPGSGDAREDGGSGPPGAQEPQGGDVTALPPPASSRKAAGCSLGHPETSGGTQLLASLSMALAALGARRRR